MGGDIVMLLVGFLAGGVAASALWAFVVFGKRRAVEALKAETEQIMASVGETLAEADAIETNFRSGAMAPEAFRRGLGDRVNAVMRLLRTNMHVLDAYFVKYAEQEAREYLRVIDNPERRKQEGPQLPAAPTQDAGMELPDPPETNLFAISQTAAPSPPFGMESIDDTFQPPIAPAPRVVDTSDDFEPVPVDVPPPGPIDTVNRHEQPHAAPAPIISAADAADSFEPPPPAVREEELVLGESPDAAGASFAYGPAPAAPIGEDSFELSAPPAPAVPPPPAPSAGDAGWTGGDSIEEFEAAFAQFEIPASQTHAAEYEETGRFSMGDVFEGPKTPIPAMEAPLPPPPPPQAPGKHADGHEFTETSSIDRNAILNAMAAAGQTLPPVQTPLFVQMPPIPMPPIHAEPAPPQPEPPQPPPQAEHREHEGITGDDVADSIDNLFNLK